MNHVARPRVSRRLAPAAVASQPYGSATVGRAQSLLDADPDLGAGLQADALVAARRSTIARTLAVSGFDGSLEWVENGADDGGLGLFVIDGLIIRSVTVGDRSACELLGDGDLIGCATIDADYDPLPVCVQWRALAPTSLAILDAGFVSRIAQYPAVTAQLVARAIRRSRRQTLMQAATRIPRVTPRLLTVFWLLAQRWGTVSSDGIRVTLPITHATLANLAGATRPTVTTALHQLAQARLLVRESPSRWLLTNDALRSLQSPDTTPE